MGIENRWMDDFHLKEGSPIITAKKEQQNNYYVRN